MDVNNGCEWDESNGMRILFHATLSQVHNTQLRGYKMNLFSLFVEPIFLTGHGHLSVLGDESSEFFLHI